MIFQFFFQFCDFSRVFFSFVIFQENFSTWAIQKCAPTEGHVILWLKRAQKKLSFSVCSPLLCDFKLLQGSLSFLCCRHSPLKMDQTTARGTDWPYFMPPGHYNLMAQQCDLKSRRFWADPAFCLFECCCYCCGVCHNLMAQQSRLVLVAHHSSATTDI